MIILSLFLKAAWRGGSGSGSPVKTWDVAAVVTGGVTGDEGSPWFTHTSGKLMPAVDCGS